MRPNIRTRSINVVEQENIQYWNTVIQESLTKFLDETKLQQAINTSVDLAIPSKTFEITFVPQPAVNTQFWVHLPPSNVDVNFIEFGSGDEQPT